MKRGLTTILVILIVIIFSFLILNRSHPNVGGDTAKCIGENSELYTQLGCHACEIQEKMFGENLKYLNITDCFYEQNKCSKIEYTPTWIINEETYTGVQSIEKLKELTGC